MKITNYKLQITNYKLQITNHQSPITNHQSQTMGFTILELMVVIMIMGMVVAMSIPAFSAYLRGDRLRTASREISSAIMLARTQAITLRRERVVSFLGTRDFGIVGGEGRTLPPGVRFNDFPPGGVKLTPMGRVDAIPAGGHIIRIFSDVNGNGTREANEPQRTITVGALGHVTITIE